MIRALYLVVLAACTTPCTRATSLRASEKQGGSESNQLSVEPGIQLTSNQFLIISSPSLGKVVYTTLNNFHSTYGRTFALIDSGLDQPAGIALDANRGHLYVADRGAKKIYRYAVSVGSTANRDGDPSISLRSDNNRLTIMSGHEVEWVAIDRSGDLFYSAKDTKNINKITSSVMSLLSDGVFQAESMTVISEKAQEAQASANAADALNTVQGTQTVTDAPGASATILSVYESSVNPNVTTPAGLTTDGLRLIWGNAVNGMTAGSVVLGEVNPQLPLAPLTGNGPSPFPATPLSKISDSVSGVCKAGGIVLFTTPSSTSTMGTATAGAIYGVSQDGGAEFTFATGLGDPKGLAWDGDATVYVADHSTGQVSSFPAGRLVDGAPLANVVTFDGAFGLAIFTEEDNAFKSVAPDCRSTYRSVTALLVISTWAVAAGI